MCTLLNVFCLLWLTECSAPLQKSTGPFPPGLRKSSSHNKNMYVMRLQHGHLITWMCATSLFFCLCSCDLSCPSADSSLMQELAKVLFGSWSLSLTPLCFPLPDLVIDEMCGCNRPGVRTALVYSLSFLHYLFIGSSLANGCISNHSAVLFELNCTFLV